MLSEAERVSLSDILANIDLAYAFAETTPLLRTSGRRQAAKKPLLRCGPVILAKAGIQSVPCAWTSRVLDSRLRGNDRKLL
jgi:hypothetical protein